jgi:hypothetical protein
MNLWELEEIHPEKHQRNCLDMMARHKYFFQGEFDCRRLRDLAQSDLKTLACVAFARVSGKSCQQ